MFTNLIAKIVAGVTEKLLLFLDKKFLELQKKIDDHYKLKIKIAELDKLAVELKEESKNAKTKEERDALLDKMDGLLRDLLRR